ncbi:unnamed protein product [Leuciscus chuanchicus]
MPKGDKSITATKASNATEQASTSPGGTNKTSSAILEAIETLKSELKEDNDKLRKDINALRQEMGNKLDNLTEEVGGLTERMEEAENRVGRVEDMTLDLTEVLTESIKRQRTGLGSGGAGSGYGRSRYGDSTTEVLGMAAGGASPARAQSPYSAEGKREIDGVSEKREKMNDEECLHY